MPKYMYLNLLDYRFVEYIRYGYQCFALTELL